MPTTAGMSFIMLPMGYVQRECYHAHSEAAYRWNAENKSKMLMNHILTYYSHDSRKLPPPTPRYHRRNST